MTRNASLWPRSRSRSRRGGSRRPAVTCLATLLVVSSAAVVRPARAQSGPPPEPASGEAAITPPADDNGAPAPEQAPATAPRTAAQSLGPYGYGNPQAPNGTIGGGNATESSAHPVTGDQEDSFDLGESSRGAGGAARGGANGPIFIGKPSYSGEEVPDTHTVRRGDTLWGICDQYFQNPYQWPRIWSYNPQLQNPHWIYPGDQIRLQLGNGQAPPTKSMALGEGSLIERHRTVAPDTVFLRDEGYVDDEDSENWGEISGAPEDHMFLGDFDHVYLRVAKAHDVKVGQELTVYRPTRQLGTGAVVQIQGTVRIDQWDAKDRIARGQIVETLDVIERGARIGPIRRRFDVVPPIRNENDVAGQVIASVRLHEFFGQGQVVFINRGAADGLKIGNRLFVIRRGDAWRQTLPTELAGMRIAVESQSPAEIDRVPHARDEGIFPENVVGELRVIALHPHSSTCVLTQSINAIELGDTAVARKGY
jgi:LysM domain